MDYQQINKIVSDKPQKIFRYLSELFPDADPSYLEQKSIEYSSNNFELDLFIDRSLKFGSYPKIKIGTSATQSRILNWITVDEYLRKIKDPVNYFKERSDGKDFQAFSVRYLRDKFRNFSGYTITNVFYKNNKNLTLSHNELETMLPDLTTERAEEKNWPYLNCKDERFHDEVYFLENQEEIKWILKEQEKKLKIEEEKIKSGKYMICQCCFNDEVPLADIITCNDGHVFCKDCVKRSSEIAIGEGKDKLTCLQECEGEFDLNLLQGILPQPIIDKFELRMMENQVKSAKIDGLCFCPFCEFAEILPEEEKIFICKKCKEISCRLCQGAPHIPWTCEEQKERNEISVRIRIEDKMSEALLRECHNCKKKFFKENGCNKMTCICGAITCYICRQPIKDYTHFNTGSCPLWSNNNAINFNGVAEAAKEGINNMRIENPSIQLQAEEFLKGLK